MKDNENHPSTDNIHTSFYYNKAIYKNSSQDIYKKISASHMRGDPRGLITSREPHFTLIDLIIRRMIRIFIRK